MEVVNPLLLLIVVAELCLGLCAMHSSQFLRWLAVHLLTRADVLDISKSERERRREFWRAELGVGPDGLGRREESEIPPIQPFARR